MSASEPKCQVLLLDYMKEFSCIGPQCEDSCCEGWTVNIDEETFGMYHQLPAGPLREKILDNLVLQVPKINPLDCARVRMRPDMVCPFLDCDRLCQIQKQLGEEYLSHVCASFPREHSIIDGIRERSASLSCPQAARLALLRPQGLRMELAEEPLSRRSNVFHRMLNTLDPAPGREVLSHFWKCRVLFLKIIGERRFSLADRLIILGVLCQRLQNLISSGKHAAVPECLDTFERELQGDSVSRDLAGIAPQPQIQLALLKRITEGRFSSGISSRRFAECYNDFLAGLKWSAEADSQSILANYLDGYRNYFAPFCEEHPHLLENYLFNHIFRYLLPLGERATVLNEYAAMVINFALIKFLLIGIFRHKRAASSDQALKLIQSFSRTFENCRSFRDNVLGLLQSEGLNSVPVMAILLKNQ